MIGLFTILTLACLATAKHGSTKGSYPTPNYVQAKEQFTFAKTYISENLRPQYFTVRDQGFSLGVLTGTLAGLAESQLNQSSMTPIEVVNVMIPYAWSHYDVVQRTYQQLENEATIKTAIVTNLIDTLCGADSVDECNRKVDARVTSAPEVYAGSARLLLALGDVGAIVNDNAETIDNISKKQLVVPYLINYVNDPLLRSFVSKLVAAYYELRKIQFRRLFDMN